jgi:hypothetical protein
MRLSVVLKPTGFVALSAVESDAKGDLQATTPNELRAHLWQQKAVVMN